eukprot:gene19592-biopygen7975
MVSYRPAVFYHSCNFTGPYTDDAVKIMAKFPMVTIEKGQGVHDPNDKRHAEDKIVDTLRRVKAGKQVTSLKWRGGGATRISAEVDDGPAPWCTSSTFESG